MKLLTILFFSPIVVTVIWGMWVIYREVKRGKKWTLALWDELHDVPDPDFRNKQLPED